MNLSPGDFNSISILKTYKFEKQKVWPCWTCILNWFHALSNTMVDLWDQDEGTNVCYDSNANVSHSWVPLHVLWLTICMKDATRKWTVDRQKQDIQISCDCWVSYWLICLMNYTYNQNNAREVTLIEIQALVSLTPYSWVRTTTPPTHADLWLWSVRQWQLQSEVSQAEKHRSQVQPSKLMACPVRSSTLSDPSRQRQKFHLWPGGHGTVLMGEGYHHHHRPASQTSLTQGRD